MSKPAAPRRRNWNPRPHTHTEAKRIRTRINGETQHVAPKMNKLLRHERLRGRMESVTPHGLVMLVYTNAKWLLDICGEHPREEDEHEVVACN